MHLLLGKRPQVQERNATGKGLPNTVHQPEQLRRILHFIDKQSRPVSLEKHGRISLGQTPFVYVVKGDTLASASIVTHEPLQHCGLAALARTSDKNRRRLLRGNAARLAYEGITGPRVCGSVQMSSTISPARIPGLGSGG